MEELSFIEKLQVLGSNIIAHPFFLIILIVPMVIMFLERDTTKKEKDVKKIILLIYVIVIAIVLFIGGSTLFELFDNVVDGLFMTLYFPNFVTLFVVIIISAIICLITVFKKNMPKVIRITNFIGFAIVQTLFCLVLVAIQSNDINIYKENALYSNSDVLTLMQLLMGAFLLQIVAISVITLINRITEMIEEKDNILTDDKKVNSNEKLISAEIKEHETAKPLVLQAKLISLKDISLTDKKDKVVKEKPDLMKPMETEKPDLIKLLPEVKKDLRNTLLTINNLKIFKTKKTIKQSRHMKYYKKVVIMTEQNHPIENLEIINFDLMVHILQKEKIKKLHTNKIT